MAKKFNRERIMRLVLLALLTATVIVLQMLPLQIGPLRLAVLALIPIVVGGALLGPVAGGWLGFVFGMVILLGPDVAPFWAFSVPGTILTILLRGICAGAVGGLVYRLLEQKNQFAAVLSAAITVPVVNTGLFVLGGLIFFLPLFEQWADGGSAVSFLFFGMIGVNFFIELGITLLLSGVILRIIQIWQKRRA